MAFRWALPQLVVRLMAPCEYCGDPVNTAASSGHYKKVTGWVRLREKGANEVALRADIGDYLHRECMDRLKLGVHPNQGSLI